MRKLILPAFIAAMLSFAALGQHPAVPQVQPQPPAPVVPAHINAAPNSGPPVAINQAMPKHQHKRGARSSRHHWLAYEATNHPKFKSFPLAGTPASFTPAVILTPAQMSMWGNDQYGDCVTAEEFAAKDVYPVWYSATGTTVDMPSSTAVQWASKYGYLDGADLTPVMDTMAQNGVTYNSTNYTDGPYTSVAYTDWTTLCSAIYQGPVKIGIAADQISNVSGVGEQNGWIATGFRNDQNEDHCVGLWGYGSMTQLCTALNVTPPANAAQYTQCLLLYTWDSIGIIDFASMNNITGEAWLRTPTTPQTVPPNPTPIPTTTYTYTLGAGAPAGSAIDVSGNLTIPASVFTAPGTITVPITVSATGMTPGEAVVTIAVNSAPAGPVIVVAVPPQTATVGQPFSLNLGQFVSQSSPTPKPVVAPQPSTPAINPMPVTPTPQTLYRKAG